MIILGVDPGLKHTGYAILVSENEGKTPKIVGRGTLIPPDNTTLTIHSVLEYIIPRLDRVIMDHRPDLAVVEQVAWYGRPKKITLPLSHVAGAIVGLLLARGVKTYLLIASMKTGKVPGRAGKTWDEHQKDAAILAHVVYRYVLAEAAGDQSYIRRHSAVKRRAITAVESAPTEPCNTAKRRKH